MYNVYNGGKEFLASDRPEEQIKMPCPNCDSNNSRKNRQIGDRQTKVPKFTPEEYFIWEEKQLLRHEYINGEVYAMTGGTQNHGRIASNIIFIVKGHLRGSGCQVGNSDCRVNILETKDYVYEVLSPITASYDRGDKFRLYRLNSSLQDYLLVDAEKIAIDLYRKNDHGNWEIFNYQSGDNIDLQSIDLSFPIESVYEDIIFEN
ncbi:Uma2 family endonuclease [Cylindrospermopsis raciborskii]|uniref:Uma2 family endonuclease n=2 Tax=Cylindrospermopsis raciborskii TaxID=77022 RepID=UPI000AC7AE69|nr:Uma2 family endonuclease [Cylindrospermopsis raciborskii]